MGRFLGVRGSKEPLYDTNVVFARRAFAEKAVSARRETLFLELCRIAAGRVERMRSRSRGGKDQKGASALDGGRSLVRPERQG